MRRASLIVLLAVASAAAALLLPAVASAGTYTWTMPGDFTAAGGGSNPDHDHYGGQPWRYVIDNGSRPTQLNHFSTNFDGGLAGWSYSADSAAFVGINPTGSAITSGSATFAPGQMALIPSSSNSVGLLWTAPTSGQFVVSGQVHADSQAISCLAAPISWVLSVNGSVRQTSGPISQNVSLAAGDRVALIVSHNPLNLLNPSCDAAGATLRIRHAVSPPTVTLANPGAVNQAQPRFRGTAGNRYGDSSTVTVRIYAGSSAGGSPLQTLTTARSGTSYVAPLNSPLANGTYTAQAEQDDLAGDRSFSGAATFSVTNTLPTVTLNSPGSTLLRTSTPTLTGTGSTRSGDSSTILLLIYPGARTSQSPIRSLLGTRNSKGHFSIEVTPALDDGTYTAVAAQSGVAGASESAPRTFRVKAHAPALTLTTPAGGANVTSQAPSFAGAAGNALGDSGQVTVTLYSGGSARGKPIGKITAGRSGASWSAQWPKALKLGLYTVTARQSDDAGHTTVTPPHSFLIVAGPSAIGTTVTLSRTDPATATVPITCLAPAGQTCSGNVLILTNGNFRTDSSGPSGQLQVMFTVVTISGGSTADVSHTVDAAVARVLRHHAPLEVSVESSLSLGGAAPTHDAGVRTLRLGS